jgi:hypothetical protein
LHAHGQRLVSLAKIATLLVECTTEEHNSVVRFCVGKVLNAKDIHKEMFHINGGKCLSRKAVHNWVEKLSQDVRKSHVMPDQVALLRLWLRQ